MSGDPSTQTVSTADVREPSSAEADCRGGSRCFFTTAVAVGLPVLVFVVLRLPALVHQPGAQDEQYFSVAGLTAATEGIPRIPYYPTRNPATFFDRADQCLMALPPGLFYAQAPFFRVFPAGYPTS
ncbi:MAG: hypothetical protein KDA89_03395, partial [Planctomycetaceae bacterium]|nr:hypothetical protein [Planctomycetaceae bacterium]